MNQGQVPPMPQANIGFSGHIVRKKYWDADINWHKFQDRKWCKMRFFGPVYMIAQSWIRSVRTNKKFPILSIGYDSDSDTYDYSKDPILADFDPFNSEVEEIKGISPRKSAFTHAIIRADQKIGNITNDPMWRPWSPVKLPVTVIRELGALREMNSFEIEGTEYTADVSDNYWGRDINIMYDAKAPTPGEKYRVQIADHTPLNEEELNFLNEIYNWRNIIEYPSYDDVKRQLQVNGYYNILAGNSAVPAAPQNVNNEYANFVLPSAPTPPTYNAPAAYTPPPMPPTSAPPPYMDSITIPPQKDPGMSEPPPVQTPDFSPPTAPPPVAPTYTPPPKVNYHSYHANQQSNSGQNAGIPIPPPPSNYNPNAAYNTDTLTQVDNLAAAPKVEIENIPKVTVNEYAKENKEEVKDPKKKVREKKNESHLRVVSSDTPIENTALKESTFNVKGHTKPLSIEEFEQAIADFANKLAATGIKKGLPLKKWEKIGPLKGRQVMACYSKYKGDLDCTKCPLRPTCVLA